MTDRRSQLGCDRSLFNHPPAKGRYGRFAAILAEEVTFMPPNYGKRTQDVTCVGGIHAIQDEEGGVELAAELKAPVRVPAKRRTAIAQVASEGREVTGGIGKLKHPTGDPVDQGLARGPRSHSLVCRWRQRGELPKDVVLHVGAAQLLPGDVVECKAIQTT